MKKLILSLALAALLSTGCGSDDTHAPSEQDAGAEALRGAEVTVEGLAFKPTELSVATGATVTWINRDEDVRHTVTSGEGKTQAIPGVDEGVAARPDGEFDGELDGTSATFAFTFDEPGTYDYFCDVHAAMRGTITVE